MRLTMRKLAIYAALLSGAASLLALGLGASVIAVYMELRRP
jgi:hypothetical protein